MKSAALVLIALVLSGQVPAWGKSPDKGLTFDDAVRTALMNNRELRAARFAVEQARGRLLQSGRWANPELTASGMSDVLFGNKGEAAFSVGLAQNFPLTSRLGIERRIGRLDVERARLEVLNHERLLIERVQLAYIRVVEEQAKAAYWQSIEAQQAALVKNVQHRLNAGQASEAELALATAARGSTWNESSKAESGAVLVLAELKSLLGFPENHSLILKDSLTSVTRQLDNLHSKRPLVLRRPDAELLVLESERAEWEIRLAKAASWEGIKIGVEYINDQGVDAPEGLGTDQFLGLNISLPLPLWDSKQGQIAEKRALRDEVQIRIEAVRIELSNSLAATLRQVAILRKRAHDLEARVVLPLRDSEQKLQAGFATGRVDLRDWLAVKAQLAEMELARTDASARLAEACAKLLAITGAHPAMPQQGATFSHKP